MRIYRRLWWVDYLRRRLGKRRGKKVIRLCREACYEYRFSFSDINEFQ
jgi:hypothetical protein